MMLRLALLGCGAMGRCLARVAVELDGVALQRCIDIDPEAAAGLAEELEVSDWSEDANDAFLRDDIDAVIIATTHEAHADLTARAAMAGKHVFVEAPLALRYPDGERVRDVVAQAGIVCCVDFAYRFAPAVKLVKARLPQPIALTLHATVETLTDVWQGEAAQGGVLALVGSHCLDLACFLAASRPVRVHAVGGRYARRAGLPDTYAAVLRFASGAVAQIVIGEFGHSRRLSSWWGTVSDGSRTATLWNDLRELRLLEGSRQVADTGDVPPAATGHADMLAAFVEAVRSGGRAPTSVDDGVRAVRLADGVYESMGIGRPVEL